MRGAAKLVPPQDVRALVLRHVEPLPPCPVSLAEAGGLVLAERVVAPEELPRFANAAMDGFAVRANDLRAPALVTLRVVGRSLAGRPTPVHVGPGEAVRIATGAVVPAGADTVVPVEETSVWGDGQAVEVRGPVAPGRHIRPAGEDVRAGQEVLAAGVRLGPGQLAAASAVGREEVLAVPRPRFGIVPTGDEVRPAGSRLGEGQVHDAVSAPLQFLVTEAGGVPRAFPPAPDDPAVLVEAVREAAAGADAVITVGGVSMGDRDLVRRLGSRPEVEVQAFRMALRPAKPFAFGRAFGVPLFGLPGNPAAALAAFEELVRPALLAMAGRAPEVRPSQRAVLVEDFAQPPGRLHLVRAEVWREGGRLLARPTAGQGSGMVGSLARANAWMVVEPDVQGVPAGCEVDVRLLSDPPAP